MEEKERHVSPGSTLEMDAVTEAYERLLGAVVEGETLTVDLSEVEAFDTSGLQLLLALSQAAVSRGGAVTYVNPSENMAKAVRQLDLVKYLGEWPGQAEMEDVRA